MTDNLKNAITELNLSAKTLHSKLDQMKIAVDKWVFKSLHLDENDPEFVALCAKQLITSEHKKFKNPNNNTKSLHISEYIDEQQQALSVNTFNIIGNYVISLFDLIQTQFEPEDDNPDYFSSKQTELLELLFKPVIANESKKRLKSNDNTKPTKFLLPFELDSLFEINDDNFKRCSAICIKDELYLRCRNKISKANNNDVCTKCLTAASQKFNNIIFTENDRMKSDFVWHNNKLPIDYYCFAAKKKYTIDNIISQCKSENIQLSDDIIKECEQKLHDAYTSIAKEQTEKPKSDKSKTKKSTEPVTNYINQAMKRNTKHKNIISSANDDSQHTSNNTSIHTILEKDNNQTKHVEQEINNQDNDEDEDEDAEFSDAIENEDEDEDEELSDDIEDDDEDDTNINIITLLNYKTVGNTKFNRLEFTNRNSKYYGTYLFKKYRTGDCTFYFDTDNIIELKKVNEQLNHEINAILKDYSK